MNYKIILVIIFNFILSSCKPIYKDLSSLELCPAGEQKIPKIFHQIWHDFGKGQPLPPKKYTDLAAELRAAHPDWDYKLWDAEESRNFIKDHYPSFLAAYDAYDKPIKRVDAIRYVILHEIGGVYVDMDTITLKNIEPLLGSCDLVLTKQIDVQDHAIVNNFMASIAGHPLMKAAIEEMPHRKAQFVTYATGPALLTKLANDFWEKKESGIFKVYHEKYLEPHEWKDKAAQPTNLEEYKQKYPESYMVSLFAGDWQSDS